MPADIQGLSTSHIVCLNLTGSSVFRGSHSTFQQINFNTKTQQGTPLLLHFNLTNQ